MTARPYGERLEGVVQVAIMLVIGSAAGVSEVQPDERAPTLAEARETNLLPSFEDCLRHYRRARR